MTSGLRLKDGSIAHRSNPVGWAGDAQKRCPPVATAWDMRVILGLALDIGRFIVGARFAQDPAGQRLAHTIAADGARSRTGRAEAYRTNGGHRRRQLRASLR